MSEKSLTLSILKAAKDLISVGWCQSARARDSNGGACWPSDANACWFCLTGAIDRAETDLRRATGPSQLPYRAFPRSAVCEKLGLGVTTSIAAWNDRPGRTQEEVVHLLATMIKEMEGEQGKRSIGKGEGSGQQRLDAAS